MEYPQNKNRKGEDGKFSDKNLSQINFDHHCCRHAHDLAIIVVAKYVWISTENYASRSERADRLFWSLREISLRFRGISL